VSGDDNQTDAVVSLPGFWEGALSLLQHPLRVRVISLDTSFAWSAGLGTHRHGWMIGYFVQSVIKETAWALSNIAAGSQPQIQRLLSSACMPIIIDLVSQSVALTHLTS
jgi:hypothetical protein